MPQAPVGCLYREVLRPSKSPELPPEFNRMDRIGRIKRRQKEKEKGNS
jgi:hypothetical protein